MNELDNRVIGLLVAGAGMSAREQELARRVRALGWHVVPVDARMEDAPALALLDARNIGGQTEYRLPPSVVACIAIIDGAAGEGAEDEAERRENDGTMLLSTGVTHFLPWPVDEVLLSMTLEAACAVALRAKGSDREADGEEEGADSDLDPLTGLVSRDAARNWLEHRLFLSRLQGEGGSAPAACLLIGISRFDSVNAAYGKAIGDIVLLRAAQRIRHCVEEVVGESALVARMGGTEYLVAIAAETVTEANMARDLARLILSDVANPFVAEERVIRLTARCGIAEPAPEDDAGRLLRRASAALADARRSGTSDICVRTGEQGPAGGDPDRLDADLRLALDRGEIGIVYQPQYDSHSDRIIGVEALARWNHPELGQLDAGTLFEAADRSDYLLPLSLHIQQAALKEAGRWPQCLKGLRLSINVTAGDLAQEGFVDRLLTMVAESGFPYDRLTVEITESGLIENIEQAEQLLQQLRQRGLRVAIDDFGTGYSSLAYLKMLHPDYLKIDHGLSRDILGTARDRIILRAIIEMARSLALTVIAEGVESEEQLTLLAREGCDIYQGFLRSPAVSSGELEELVLKA
ncbi:MAG: bifunctional diguanylate cyclase/phosphodiesterase [Sphingomonadales bacterium]|nr:MAG: bifunctional diguanylate cyclase/phosphodiesterase [Sphingomonadales bacterium]TNF04908.1 MAG: bifunctional diguanylate cyclase/phosphodiesterase [Sphingomonadales bacterium]